MTAQKKIRLVSQDEGSQLWIRSDLLIEQGSTQEESQNLNGRVEQGSIQEESQNLNGLVLY